MTGAAPARTDTLHPYMARSSLSSCADWGPALPTPARHLPAAASPSLAIHLPAAPSTGHGLGSGMEQIDAHVLFDPPLVVKKLKAGWKDHIPLISCTNAACLLAAKVTDEEDESLLVDGTGRVKMIATKIPGTERELSMTGQDFMEAYPCLVRLIETFYPGPDRHALARAYETHFSNLARRPDFYTNIDIVVAYDVSICRHHLQSSFNPAAFQVAIWNDVWAKSMERAFRPRLAPATSSAAGPSRNSYADRSPRGVTHSPKRAGRQRSPFARSSQHPNNLTERDSF